MMLLLLLVPAVSWAYIPSKNSQHSNDSRYLPVFSNRNDVYLEAGQQFNVNCSFFDRLWKLDCSGSGSWNHHNQSSTYTNSKTDCQNQSYAFSQADLDKNSMKIIHCPTQYRDSCIVQNTTILNNRTLSLRKLSLRLSDTGTYICQYNNTITTESTFYMKIGYKPHGPDDISCISEDLHGLHCSWSKSQLDLLNPFPVKYKSYFISSPHYGRFDCPHPSPQGCSVLSSGVKGENYTYDFLKNFVFYVNASTICCGNNISEYKIKPQEIVKLSPPMMSSVTIAGRNITFMMELSSKTNISLFLIKSILYDISYMSQYSDIKTISMLSSNRTIPVTLTGMNPFTYYTISIRSRGSKTRGSNYWSTTVTSNYTTTSAVPDAVPDISPGGFCRRNGPIFLYLKPILRKERNSADARYKIETSQNYRLVSVSNVSWEDTTVNLHNLLPRYTYQIEIRTVNDVGQSRNIQRIAIPAYNTTRKAPEYIVVEKSSKNYTLSWRRGNMSTIKEIIVYWCHGDRQNQECKSDLNWITIYDHHTSVIIPDLEDKNGGDWMFAIAYQYTDGYNTGMSFVKCYFSSTTNAPTSIPPYNVVDVSRTELEIRPLVFCSRLYPSRPLQFVIYYKEHKWDACDNSFKNRTVIAGADVENVTLRNLKPSTYYTICLSVITKGGYKTSSASHTKTLAISEPESENIYIIILCMVGILVCVSLALVVFCKIRNMCKEPMDINLPKLNIKYRKVAVSELDRHGCLKKKFQDSGYLSASHQDSTMLSVTDDNKVENGNVLMKCRSSDDYNTDSEQSVCQTTETTMNKPGETHQPSEITSNASSKNNITPHQPNEITSHLSSKQTTTSHHHNGPTSNLSSKQTITHYQPNDITSNLSSKLTIIPRVQTSNANMCLTLLEDVEKNKLKDVVFERPSFHYILEKDTPGYIHDIPDYIQTVNSGKDSFSQNSSIKSTDYSSEPKQYLSNHCEIPGSCYVSGSNFSEISDYIKAARCNSNTSIPEISSTDNGDKNYIAEYIQV